MSVAPATGIVLAGGSGRRFGGPKLATMVAGRPLLDHAILAVAAVTRDVVVVGPPDGEGLLLPPLPGDAPVPVRLVRDAVAGAGPLAGLATGLAAARQPLVIVVGGDQPELVPALLDELLRLAMPGSGQVVDAVALEDGGRLRPLPVAFRVATAGPLVAAALDAGDRSLLAALGRMRIGVLPADRWRPFDPFGASLRDVDRPGDLPDSPGDLPDWSGPSPGAVDAEAGPGAVDVARPADGDPSSVRPEGGTA